MIFFFFSSRRRHTRSLRDWSSDVCSCDLTWTRRSSKPAAHPMTCPQVCSPGTSRAPCARYRRSTQVTYTSTGRSEERRVGKECRSRWAQYHEKEQREEQVEQQRDRESDTD